MVFAFWGPMKAFFIISFAAFFLTSSFLFAASEDPAVVSSVDFARYAGTWKEIAHNPNFFQKNCQHSSAEYGILDSKRVSVHNICFKADGTTSDIRGVATVTNPAVPAKLKVKFNPFARGDYWIVRLEPDYSWAVVSGPKRKSLFILARTAPMEPAFLDSILKDLEADGFDTKSLVFDKY
jgi:apolipoprotein D and lipocalin family protein